jgi:hypothetical protein
MTLLAVILTLIQSVGPAAETASASTAGESAATATSEVVLYYFHGAHRCKTCRSMEAYAQEALETKFKKQLETGALQWKVLNMEEPENEHFAKDFELVSSSLVLVELNGGDVVRHEVLQEAWKLVRDEPSFVKYVQESVHKYLK